MKLPATKLVAAIKTLITVTRLFLESFLFRLKLSLFRSLLNYEMGSIK